MTQWEKHSRALVSCLFLILDLINFQNFHTFPKPNQTKQTPQTKTHTQIKPKHKQSNKKPTTQAKKQNQSHQTNTKNTKPKPTPNLEKVMLVCLYFWQVFQLTSNFGSLSRSFSLLFHHFCRPHCAIVCWPVIPVLPL